MCAIHVINTLNIVSNQMEVRFHHGTVPINKNCTLSPWSVVPKIPIYLVVKVTVAASFRCGEKCPYSMLSKHFLHTMWYHMIGYIYMLITMSVTMSFSTKSVFCWLVFLIQHIHLHIFVHIYWWNTVYIVWKYIVVINCNSSYNTTMYIQIVFKLHYNYKWFHYKPWVNEKMQAHQYIIVPTFH